MHLLNYSCQITEYNYNIRLHNKMLIITLKHNNLEYICYLLELKYSSVELYELGRRTPLKADLKTCISFTTHFL